MNPALINNQWHNLAVAPLLAPAGITMPRVFGTLFVT
jgi:hypothetical protein